MRSKGYLVAVALLSVACMADAGSISSGSRSFSSPSSTRPSSIGMQRPSVAPTPPPRPAPTQAAKPQATKPTVPAPTTSPQTYRQPEPTVGHNNHSGGNNGSNSGSGFLSSLLGAGIGGYIGSSLGTHSASTAAAPAVVGNPAGSAGGAPVSYSSGLGFWDVFFFVLFLAGMAWLAYKAYCWYMKNNSQKLPFDPVGNFIAVQKAYAEGDKYALKALLGPAMQQMLYTMPENGKYSLSNISYDLVSYSHDVVTILYRADDNQPDCESVQEYWHWIKVGNTWKLNGITQTH